MDLELKPLREKGLKHQVQRTHGAQRLAFHVSSGPGIDVETIRVQPAGPTGHLEILKLIRLSNDHAQRYVRSRESPARGHRHELAPLTGFVPFDRRHLERG